MDAAVLAVAAGAGVVGAVTGSLITRVAGRFPWPSGVPAHDLVARGPVAVRSPVLEVGTAALLASTVVAVGLSWALPAFLLLAVAAVLLAVIDLRHRLLPDRVVLPTLAVGAALLAGAALAEAAWPAFLRAVLGAATLFAVFLVLALISPSGLGMGDVKLAAVLGLFLGWLGWAAVLIGAVAGFVVQAALALVLLALGRVRGDSELPFGPAMLLGAALTIALASS
jgi:leader peptidase (prepilin peptidase) / N-methyltransferase